MHQLEDGILETSEIYFCSRPRFAERALFYLQHLGIFECDARYVVSHPYWESVLLLFVDEGELEVSFARKCSWPRKGDAVLLDCRYEHIYHALNHLKFHYIHFAGKSAFEYASLLYDLNHSALLQKAGTDTMNSSFQNLLHLARSADQCAERTPHFGVHPYDAVRAGGVQLRHSGRGQRVHRSGRSSTWRSTSRRTFRLTRSRTRSG